MSSHLATDWIFNVRVWLILLETVENGYSLRIIPGVSVIRWRDLRGHGQDKAWPEATLL